MPVALEDLARRWAAAKDEVTRLKRERNALYCDNEETITEGPGPGPDAWMNATNTYGVAFWKATRIDPVTLGDVPAVDPADWCEPCVARQALHDKIAPARKALTTATRALLRAARRLVTG